MLHPDLIAAGERVLAAIRDVQRECDYQSCAHGAAPEHMPSFFKADALGAFLDALNDGMAPDEAAEQSRQQVRQCVRRWNDSHTGQRDMLYPPMVGDTAIDDALRTIRGAMREMSTVDNDCPAEVNPEYLAVRDAQPRKPMAAPAPKPNGKASGETWLALHAAAKAAHPEMIVLLRRGECYLAYGEDANIIAAVLGVKSHVQGEYGPCAGIPAATFHDGLRKIIDAGHRVALCEPQPEGGVATTRAEPEPPPDLERDAIRARYFAIPLRHVKGEGTVAKRKGVVKGSIVGPFLVHADKECGWRITHHATGYAMGHLHFAAPSEAKLFAWLMAQDGDWDFGAATACGKETMAHVNALAMAWRANDWRKIAELCPLSE